MKTRFLLLAALLMSALAAGAQGKRLIVESRDGTTVTFLLSDDPVVSFAGENVEITSAAMNVSLPIYDTKSFRFGGSGIVTTGVDKPAQDRPFSVDDECIHIKVADGDVQFDMTDMRGVRVVTRKIARGEAASVDISHLVAGVYIVRLNGLTYKIVKR